MSRKGDLSPELANLLHEIADRIQSNTTTKTDWLYLRRIARQAAGDDKRIELRLHSKQGAPRKGALGVIERLTMAEAVRDYMSAHGCSVEAACWEISQADHGWTWPAKDETIRKAWQEMSPLFEMTDLDRKITLTLKGLKADGFGVVEAKPTGK